MDITYNKVDETALPISINRVSASEYNQIAGSLMNIITSAGLTPDSQDNAQLLTALQTFIPVITNNVDYTAGSSVTFPVSGSTFTAPYDGIYVVSFKGNNNETTLYINGIASGFQQSSSSSNRDCSTMTIPLSAGDEIYWDRTYTPVTSIFYPYKGVN